MSDPAASTIATRPAKLLAGYRPLPGVFDELLAPDGELRPHYAPLIEALDNLGSAELNHRRQAGDRLIQEQGVTYNVHGDPQGRERPWKLDPIPLLVAASEWRGLEAALIQRATLLNRILADCYGPQHLVRSGRLPPALVFAQPDFLRPCHGIRPAKDTFLHLYAADLARSADGRWWVISDRTQIPTGAGYALENRLVTSRILPEPFRDCQVHRLASFFRALQESLTTLGRQLTENPRVVLLSPGPYNETYFEQAYLARYLGFTLVEGEDLAVRDGRVFLKTLSGLESVHVLLRRVDDEFCDPLELRNESMLGVPGLVEALREGTVVVANMLGSGLVQSPALMAFLPGFCQHLMGEELQLPSVATWWCGQKPAAEYVREHLDKLLLHTAFRVAPSSLTEAVPQSDHQELEKRLAFQPHLLVGQERVVFSTAPAWSSDGLVAGQISVRVYLVASAGTYKVMAGGLARVAIAGAAPELSMQHGGASKDVWVLSDQPVPPLSLLTQSSHFIELRRVGNNLPSRVADNFFWLGRYAERAQASARLLRCALSRYNPEGGDASSPVLLPLVQTLERQGQLFTEGGLGEPPSASPAELELELMSAVFDPKRAGSLRSVVDRVQQITVLLRDRLSLDTWRLLRQLDAHLSAPGSPDDLRWGEASRALNQTILGLAAFDGLAMENMTRAQGWRFLEMGHRIERSIYLCALLGCALRSPDADNASLLEALLEIADCSLTYRSRYNLLPHITAVYDLVLLDDTNPRSLIFQLEQLAQHFERLPRENERALPGPAERILLESLTVLRLADPTELDSGRKEFTQTEIAEVIGRIGAAMPRLSDSIAISHFTHSTVARAGAAADRTGPEVPSVPEPTP
ncbi:MAG TPA: circularly permuted type 2 ATP-grasp protein [Dongiaceae bacterium]|nr:circularly permuted type 2 ATP-grasp protein [Dongiaceae bacterium]